MCVEVCVILFIQILQSLYNNNNNIAILGKSIFIRLCGGIKLNEMDNHKYLNTKE